MDLNIYQVIKKPIISNKAYTINSKLKQLMLEVHPQANKPLIKLALEKLFNVKVADIRVNIRKGKQRKVGRKVVHGSDKKIAIVALKQGFSIDIFGTSQVAPGAAAEQKE